jgi:hypothetical protein
MIRSSHQFVKTIAAHEKAAKKTLLTLIMFGVIEEPASEAASL